MTSAVSLIPLEFFSYVKDLNAVSLLLLLLLETETPKYCLILWHFVFRVVFGVFAWTGMQGFLVVVSRLKIGYSFYEIVKHKQLLRNRLVFNA